MKIPHLKKIAVCSILFGFRLIVPMKHFISSEEMTHSAIGETFYRIKLYAKKNMRLPSGLAELPDREGYINMTTDAWGNGLVYIVMQSGSVSLSSYGADGVKGGSGENTDISRSYRWQDDRGRFIAGDDDWPYDCEGPC